jgi:hypothetical protein
MSKKLYSSNKWKNRVRERQQYELRRLTFRKRRPRFFASAKPFEKRNFLSLRVPTVFSFVKNPEEMIRFVNQLKFYASKHNVSLDLSDLSDLTSDAIAVLTATLAATQNAQIRGNMPSNPALKEILVQSGFFQHVRSWEPVSPCTKGRIAQKQSRKVEPAIARDLIHLGMQAIYGAPLKSPSAYRTLIESMNNTHNHAAKSSRSKETWWSTVFADLQRRRVCYTFVDVGVGIFRSVRLDPFRRIYRVLGTTSNADILREIFEGKIESRTGIPYRGKGLPAIFNLSELGRIKSLVIISNDVYANVSTGAYRELNDPFRGTLLYWEID